MALSPELIGCIGVIGLLILLFLKIPIAYVLAFVGFIGYWLISGLSQAMSITGMTFYSTIASYGFSVVPLFLIMGYFAFHTGMITNLFSAARKGIGHIPGGLALATIAGGAGFGAVSGSGIASTATLARVTIPEMVKGGVDRKLAYGVVASAGPLAQMIPPSIMMVMYAIIAEQPVGALLIGGILPGVLTALAYMMMVYIRVKINPSLAQPVKRASWGERISSLNGLKGFLFLGIIIIVGIYTGIFTPTEAGAVGAFVAFLMLLFQKKLAKAALRDSIIETVKTTSMVFFIVASAFLFGNFLGITRLPTHISTFLTELPVPPIIILIGIVIMYLILGMFIDMLAAMFLTLPIILPAIEALGFDLVWFGVLLVFLAEVALVTPPFGISLFIIKGTQENSDYKEIVQGCMPFIFVDLVMIALFIAFPWIITFLPSLMGG